MIYKGAAENRSFFIINSFQTNTLANIEDTDEIPHHVVFHLGLKFFAEIKNEFSTCDPITYKMGNTILILSTCMLTFNRLKRINNEP